MQNDLRSIVDCDSDVRTTRRPGHTMHRCDRGTNDIREEERSIRKVVIQTQATQIELITGDSNNIFHARTPSEINDRNSGWSCAEPYDNHTSEKSLYCDPEEDAASSECSSSTESAFIVMASSCNPGVLTRQFIGAATGHRSASFALSSQASDSCESDDSSRFRDDRDYHSCTGTEHQALRYLQTESRNSELYGGLSSKSLRSHSSSSQNLDRQSFPRGDDEDGDFNLFPARSSSGISQTIAKEARRCSEVIEIITGASVQIEMNIEGNSIVFYGATSGETRHGGRLNSMTSLLAKIKDMLRRRIWRGRTRNAGSGATTVAPLVDVKTRLGPTKPANDEKAKVKNIGNSFSRPCGSQTSSINEPILSRQRNNPLKKSSLSSARTDVHRHLYNSQSKEVIVTGIIGAYLVSPNGCTEPLHLLPVMKEIDNGIHSRNHRQQSISGTVRRRMWNSPKAIFSSRRSKTRAASVVTRGVDSQSLSQTIYPTDSATATIRLPRAGQKYRKVLSGDEKQKEHNTRNRATSSAAFLQASKGTTWGELGNCTWNPHDSYFDSTRRVSQSEKSINNNERPTPSAVRISVVTDGSLMSRDSLTQNHYLQ